MLSMITHGSGLEILTRQDANFSTWRQLHDVTSGSDRQEAYVVNSKRDLIQSSIICPDERISIMLSYCGRHTAMNVRCVPQPARSLSSVAGTLYGCVTIQSSAGILRRLFALFLSLHIHLAVLVELFVAVCMQSGHWRLNQRFEYLWQYSLKMSSKRISIRPQKFSSAQGLWM